MLPITIEFKAGATDDAIKEESVSLESAEALFDFIAPGGGCEKLSSDLGEIQMMFASPKHPNVQNPIADKRVSLQLGLVFLNGPLAEIVQVAQEIIDRVGRGELSEAFMNAIHAGR